VVTTVGELPGGSYAEYSVSGDNVVDSLSSPGADNRVMLYNVATGAWRPISPDAAGSPSIRGSTVAWATNPYFDRDPTLAWSVQVYDLRGGIKTIAGGPVSQGYHYVAQAGGRVAYTSAEQGAAQSLYLAYLP
jgi:hypothetical protein